MANDTVRTGAPRATDRAVHVVAGPVEAALHDFLDAEGAAMVALDDELAPLVAVARDAVLAGGKRMRPTFAYWGWRGLAGPDTPTAPIVPALAALELLHAFALVHDDVMDDSDTRRGRPTAHRVLADTHRARGMRGDPGRFGEAGAILVGDLCLVWADRLIARWGVKPEAWAEVRRHYDLMRVEAIAGQFLDVLGESSWTWSVERALRTARMKTAGYTVTGPLRYGAALADGAAGPRTAAVARAYERYGRAVGEAFQLRDDLLGFAGDPAVTGKPIGDDLLRGKPTVLLQLARSRATGRRAVELERLLRRRRHRAGDVDRLTALVRETGAPSTVVEMIGERVADARAALAAAPIDPLARMELDRLAGAAGWRTT
jgi:geranylgeranyl diphosphate synthase type I